MELNSDISNKKKYKILIVEDVPVQAKKLQYILEKLGYEVTWMTDGQKALSEIPNKKYSLIISDYQMPNLDGLELLEELKANKNFAKIPFILITTIEDNEVFFKSLQLGASEFLNKPYRPEELKLRCQNIIMLYEYQTLIEQENVNLLDDLKSKNEILQKNFEELADSHKLLQTLQAELIQSSKMASLGTMGAGMAHEINNPLTIIKSYNQQLNRIINRDEIDQNKIIKINGNIETAVNRIIKIVKHLKAFSRNEDLNNRTLEDFDLNILFKDLYDFFGGLITKNNIEMIEDFSAQPAIVSGFKTLIEQVFLNLVHNAIDAMDKSEIKKMTFKTVVEGNKIIVTFSDTGCGIPSDIQSKIFDPFFTTKDVNKGTGLGMSLVEGYIKEHDATINLESTSKGTAFTIIFNNN